MQWSATGKTQERADMSVRKIAHMDPREGYNRWAETYDQTPNPVVSMDNRYTLHLLAPKAGERILDAACGTGRHFAAILQAGSQLIGIDFAPGMLRVAQQRYPHIPLILADLQHPLPLQSHSFDAVLCSLVGEHLSDLPTVFQELYRVLRPGGRLLFSVYHPAMAAAGIEANFQQEGVEIRLGAYRHTVEDYVESLDTVGFVDLQKQEFLGDEDIAAAVPQARKYVGFPLLLIIKASTKAGDRSNTLVSKHS
jgi:ubiquinone/menaquinone biosynthesis C-methylase UbiE